MPTACETLQSMPGGGMMPDLLASELVPIDSLTTFPNNPRRGDVDAIVKSLQAFGQTRPIIVQRATGFIVGGNHVWAAAKVLAWTHINAVFLDLDDTTARRVLLADNQIPARGQNDPDALTAFVRDLYQRGGIDEAIGFESEQLDRFLIDVADTSELDEAQPRPEAKDVYVQPGELWQLGPHRLYVGDATDPASYERLLGKDTVQLIWTDPPYGVGIVGGTPDHLTIANDEPDAVSLRALLDASMKLSVERLDPGRGVYVAGPGGRMSRVFLEVLEGLDVYRQTIVWVKDALVLGRADYHWRHELIYTGLSPGKRKRAKEGSPVHYGWRPGAAHFFITDRTLDSVWEIPRPKRSAVHPTMKPVELVERSIIASTRRGETVLDQFVGSGTTIVACEHARRAARAIELDAAYAQVSIERWQEYAGAKATLVP
jgi:site-specific DNA-methyltransferase (adenine-specific)